jgi:hypothetical protein
MLHFFYVGSYSITAATGSVPVISSVCVQRVRKQLSASTSFQGFDGLESEQAVVAVR